ncbi:MULTISPECIES: LytR C-terminal domain-containing protein [unclassified Halorhodospira]|uniref:LytR C-terminal domain-containing protein n=1 Tax=unclassified Halorhodospira TaxID=2626748 RepID=UPI001EE8F586|nr:MULTISPECIES: LytR C-terminal domain-containing protein [unclassified Halorhodospira]MCG5541530.1 LytR C-terminal domain-containing protein [Halorhodospira sp. M39old]MCG5546286.1 LytR C-terminal domain-containing protein [Halorhodospira sp. M38]
MDRKSLLAMLGLSLCGPGAVASAADPTGVRGAEVLDDGATVHALSVGSQTWSGSDREDARLIEPRLRYGLPAGYEIGLSAQHRAQGDDGSGLRHLALEAATPLRQDVGAADITLAGYGTVAPVDDDSGIGSGSHNLGLGLHLSDGLGETRLHSSMALERADVAEVDGQPGYRAVNRLRYGARAEHRVAAALDLTLEAAAVYGLSGDEVQNQFGLALRPGVRLHLAPTVDLSLTAGRDLPDAGVEPTNTVTAQLTHRPQPAPSRGELEARIDHLEAAHASTRARAAMQAGRADEQRERIELLRRRAGQLDVEVINASGEAGLGRAMAERLREEGHYVVRIQDSARAGDGQQTTHIRYRAGHGEQAVALGESLERIQEVTEGELPRGADVRILVGRDQREPLGHSAEEDGS